jgi:hypothetical protein
MRAISAQSPAMTTSCSRTQNTRQVSRHVPVLGRPAPGGRLYAADRASVPSQADEPRPSRRDRRTRSRRAPVADGVTGKIVAGSNLSLSAIGAHRRRRSARTDSKIAMRSDTRASRRFAIVSADVAPGRGSASPATAGRSHWSTSSSPARPTRYGNSRGRPAGPPAGAAVVDRVGRVRPGVQIIHSGAGGLADCRPAEAGIA